MGIVERGRASKFDGLTPEQDARKACIAKRSVLSGMNLKSPDACTTRLIMYDLDY